MAKIICLFFIVALAINCNPPVPATQGLVPSTTQKPENGPSEPDQADKSTNEPTPKKDAKEEAQQTTNEDNSDNGITDQEPSDENLPHKTSVDFAALDLELVEISGTDCSTVMSGFRPDHLRLAMHENPTSEIIISWTTSDLGTTHLVAFDTQPHTTDLQYRQSIQAQKSGAYDDGSEFYHQAALSRLTPDTVYYFMLVSDEKRSAEFHFRTAPSSPDKSFKILGGGDSRSDEQKRSEMNTVMRNLLVGNPEIIALSHGGDFVGSDTYENWDCWMRNHQLTTTDSGRVLPVIATQGNHEGNAKVFTDIWASPGGSDKHYYTTEIGEFALLTLNSEISILGDQLDFLDQELSRLVSKSTKWILSAYHRPGTYSGQKGPADTKNWTSYFDKYRVDLVLESDGHIIKKTNPIGTGTIYVGEGGLGVPQRSGALCDDSSLNFDYCGSSHHVQLIEISPKEIKFRIFTDAGTEDQAKGFSISPKDRPE